MDMDQFPCSICPNQVFESRMNLLHHVSELHKDKTCPNCGKGFSTIQVLRLHLKTHVPVGDRPKFKCPVANCSRDYYSKWNLKLHNETMHTGTFSKYWCRTCGATFPSRERRDDHFRNVHNGLMAYLVAEYKCPVDQCHKKYRDKGNLKRHLKSRHSSTPRKMFNCDQCCKEYLTKCALNQHVKQTHSRTATKYDCNLCQSTFSSKIGRDYHIVAIHTGEKAFRCEECPAKFASKANLQNHQFVHREDKPHKCKSCTKQFKRPLQLKSHIRHMHSQRTNNFQCTTCQKTFFIKSNLTAHSRTHGQVVLQHCCYFCPKAFLRRGELEIHLRTHTQEKPYFCSEESCKYSTTATDSLKRHAKSHHPPIGGQIPSRSRIWTCYFCFKTFCQSKLLINHLRTHTTETPFSCGLCKKAFRTHGILQGHILSHTKEKSFRCPHCQNCFTFNSSLKDHIASVHLQEKRFFCEVCSYSSFRRFSLIIHQRRRHPPINV